MWLLDENKAVDMYLFNQQWDEIMIWALFFFPVVLIFFVPFFY